MDIQKAETLFIELRDFLIQLNKKYLWVQTRNAFEAAAYLEQAENDEEKEEIVRTYYYRLFPARGGLTDVVIWDDDFETRKSLNARLKRIEKDLDDLMPDVR